MSNKLENVALLEKKLSHGATITTDLPTRWSSYGAPRAIACISVSSEDDVAAAVSRGHTFPIYDLDTVQVKHCNEHNMPFLVQNGGSGWARFKETTNLIIIDLSRLKTFRVSEDKRTAVIGGGLRVSEAIEAADAAGVLIVTGNCNCVGVLGASLGGGFGNLMGQFGFGVDNIAEMRVVTADGQVRTISATQEEDLFWAMRGAGSNFGIVTSAIVKTYAMPKDERSAWCGILMFSEDKLEQVVDAVENIKLTSRMVCFMYFVTGGPPSNAPAIVVSVWLFQGNPETGKEAFKSFYDIEPFLEDTKVLPYTEWNTGANPFGVFSQRKPSFTAGLNRLDPQAWRQVWNKLVAFQQKPTAQASAILLETYPETEQSASAFTRRTVRSNAININWYTDESLDEEAIQCGKEIREIWRNSGGLAENASYVHIWLIDYNALLTVHRYINFAHGDESLEEIYGDSLPRLLQLKSIFDPENRFNQWFNIR